MHNLFRGDDVRVEMTKWVDRPHWAFDGRWLGSDEHGDWIGFPAGTPMSRPGANLTTTHDQVGLAPRPDLLTGGFFATLHGFGATMSTYVDMCTRPAWDGATLRAVDLDLDVIRRLGDATSGDAGATGDSVFVDDEDEFAEHRVAHGYPADVVTLAETSCAAVLDAVRARTTPFDDWTKRRWLRSLQQLDTRAPGRSRNQ